MLPYRRAGDEILVLLITSRKAARWVLPKGIVEPGMSAPASAAKEAWVEAGIAGEVLEDLLSDFDALQDDGQVKAYVARAAYVLVLALLADEAEAQARVVAARAAPVLSAPEVASLIEANVGEETAPRFFEFVASSGA